MNDPQPMPTDAELDAVVQDCRVRGLREPDVFRAVLAKWGTPPAAAPAEQPAKSERWNPLEGGNPETALQMAAVIAHRDATQPNTAYAALPMESAPKDGTMLRLQVMFEDGALEDDNSKPIWTIGFNNLGNTGEDEWQFAGWNWSHDCFSEGTGTPVGWLPMLDASSASRGQAPAVAAPEVLDKATKHSRLKYKLTTSRTAFQAGALFALNTMRDQPAPAPSVLEDAARLDFLIEQRAYVVSDPDACPGYWLHFIHKETGKCWVQCDEHPTPRAAIDAARKQGANHD